MVFFEKIRREFILTVFLIFGAKTFRKCAKCEKTVENEQLFAVTL